MFVISVILCFLLNNLNDVHSEDPDIMESYISEVNSTDLVIGENFSWQVGTKHIIEYNVLNSTKEETIYCLDPSGNIVEGDGSKRIFSQLYSTEATKGDIVTSLRLSFEPATIEDNGIWKFYSKNGSLQHTFSICVLDRIRILNQTTVFFASHGRSTTLKCKASGEPSPMFQWYRNEELITDDDNPKYKISTKFSTNHIISTLTVAKLTKEDNGLYVCKASQRHPTVGFDCSYSDSKDFMLKVKYAPTLKTSNSDTIFYSIKGERVHIRCDADGYPKPKFTWYKVNGSSLISAVNGEDLILNIDETSFGSKYTCSAVNFEGRVYKTYVIAKTLKPQSPDYINFYYNETVQHLVLNWNDQIKYPIQEVDVEYLNEECKTKRDSNWERSTKINCLINKEIYYTLSVTFNSLNEYQNYCIRLRVINKAGSSPWSSPITTYNFSSNRLVKTVAKKINYQKVIRMFMLILDTIPSSFFVIIHYILGYF